MYALALGLALIVKLFVYSLFGSKQQKIFLSLGGSHLLPFRVLLRMAKGQDIGKHLAQGYEQRIRFRISCFIPSRGICLFMNIRKDIHIYLKISSLKKYKMALVQIIDRPYNICLYLKYTQENCSDIIYLSLYSILRIS